MSEGKAWSRDETLVPSHLIQQGHAGWEHYSPQDEEDSSCLRTSVLSLQHFNALLVRSLAACTLGKTQYRSKNKNINLHDNAGKVPDTSVSSVSRV